MALAPGKEHLSLHMDAQLKRDLHKTCIDRGISITRWIDQVAREFVTASAKRGVHHVRDDFEEK